ncbi:copper amine oxidase N-terminal domain-containing protein [Desulfofundulus sp.]|uniref:copper amine oxidase N-terminal domain-containing protein n=1 Tax=Desulfofundulus sp. TaxID=2282750 RepID=UPI003C7367E4
MKRLRLVLLLFVVACALVLASAGGALAATTNSALWCPKVSPDTTAQLGGLYISESNAMSIKQGDSVTLTLPSFVELQKMSFKFVDSSSYFPSKAGGCSIQVIFNPDLYSVQATVYDNSNGYQSNTQSGSYGDEKILFSDNNGSELWIQATSRQSVTLKLKAVPRDQLPKYKYFRTFIYFDQVNIKPVAPEDLDSSDIKVTLDAPSTSGFSSGSVTIGTLVTAGGSTITAASPASITDAGGSIADITLKEDVPGALKNNADVFPQGNTVKLVLSPGFTWDTVTLIPQGGFGSDSVAYDVYSGKDGCSALYLKINQESSGSPGQIIIKASVKANEPYTTARDVKVTYSGTNPGVGGEKIAEVTVAKYLVSGVSVAARSTLDVVAGRAGQQVGNFTIAEGMPGDLPQGRLISLTLPEGAKWRQKPTVSREAGDGVLEYYDTRDDGRTLVYKVTTASKSRTSFCFKNATVDLALNVPEELAVTVKGPGLDGTVTVAHVQAPVAVSAAGGTVRAGAQEQAVGALTIKENLLGALRARDAAGNRAVLKLTLPSGVRFTRVPTVQVSAGDLELDGSGIKLEDKDRTLVIPVKLSSATPVEQQLPETGQGEESAGESESSSEAVAQEAGSTVTVQDISLTVDRTAPEGDITLEVSGSALTETADLFSSSDNQLTCVLARCLTPAPVSIKAGAVFTIGSNKYRTGDEEKEMDVAPYVKNGRTFAPVRYLALAAGLKEENILWDAKNRTVTILAGKRVVQFKVGQKSYLIQGVPISMDVAPEIVNGRLMLPYRFVAQALGLQARWLADSRQVVIS